MDRDTLLELIAAYALDALDEDEQREVEMLLASDVEARQLLEEYQAVTDMLLLLVPAQQTPATSRTILQQRLAENRPPQPALIDSPQVDSDAPKPKRRLPSRRWLVLSSAAAAALIVVLVGLWIVLRPEPGPTEAQRLAYSRDIYNQILEQEGAQRLPIDPAISGVEGDLAIAPDTDRVALRLQDLPVLEEGKAFQLWVVDIDTRSSGGIFHWREGHGPYYVVVHLNRPLAQYVGMGMSIEPVDGSPLGNAPTGPRVWGLALATQEQ